LPAGQPSRPLLSVIVPTLNEAQALPALLDDLSRQQGVALEVVVGDGGSTDDTERVAAQHGARVVTARRGRGAQMNAAAAQAIGEYFLFLHADSKLEDLRLLGNALAVLRQAEQEQPRVAGHFRLRFCRATRKNGWAYRYLEAKTGLNRPGTTNGDQGLLLSRTFFHHLGGFDDSLPFLEDQRIADAIRFQGRWITLPGALATSARRFESEGFHRRYLLMGIMMGLYAIGELSFFTRAPGVYRVQEATGRLLLAPIFALLWSMVRHDWGLSGTLRTFYRLGRYLRRNAWQPFFFLDICMQPVVRPGSTPLLHFHDRFIAPCLDFRLVDGCAGLVCFVWYLAILAPVFWGQEVWVRTMKNRRSRNG